MTDIPTGLYEIWKLEKRVWTDGPIACQDFIRPDALIVPPEPMPPMTFAALLQSAGRAKPFTDVTISERHFVQHPDALIISYLSSAKHPRFRQRYHARCMTTYLRESGVWKVAGHHHVRIKPVKAS